MQKGNGFIDFIKGREGGYKQNIEIIGNETAIIENIDSIIEYSEEHIRLLIKNKYLIIRGNGLNLSDYREKSIYIKGRISEIIFE